MELLQHEVTVLKEELRKMVCEQREWRRKNEKVISMLDIPPYEPDSLGIGGDEG